MLCRDIINVIERKYSRKYALEWDNVGLLIGRDDKEVRCIYVAVDATNEVIEDAISHHADMLVTHHPMIFGAMKQINNLDFTGKRVLKIIQNDISYYAMHTNYDVLGMAELSGKMLGLQDAEVLEVTWTSETGKENRTEGIGRIANLDQTMSLRSCCEKVKEVFKLETVKVFGNLNSEIKRVAICPGSGKSVIQTSLDKKADVLITGDISHHEGIDAAAQGIAIIDAGHYGIEHIFVADMKHYLTENLNGISVIDAPIHHPFIVL